jgi:hypothetical protein
MRDLHGAAIFDLSPRGLLKKSPWNPKTLPQKGYRVAGMIFKF